MSSLGNKRIELFDMGGGASDPTADENVQVASGEIRTLSVSPVEQCLEPDIIWKNKSCQHFHVSRDCCYFKFP